MTSRRTVLSGIPAGLALASLSGRAWAATSAKEAGAIAEEALVYGFPMVMGYGVAYEFFLDKASPQFKAPINQLANEGRVFTPADTAVVTPNSDTPYSLAYLDLRAEPMVFRNPEIEKDRYWSLQLVDLYTFNFGYAGSRTTGNAAGVTMIAGPHWKSEKPKGVDHVIPCETEFALAIVRTQLFAPDDIDKVRAIQAGYVLEPLSKFHGTKAPKAALEVAWPKIDKELGAKDPFGYLNFVLQFCPPIGPAAVEKKLRERFAEIGIEAGKPFPAHKLHKDAMAALPGGVEQGLGQIKAEVGKLGTEVNGWRISANSFGDRKMIDGDWARRAAAAMAGIYGNDAEEALYPLLDTASDGKKPDCTTNKYTLTFPGDGLPPVNAFWSVTMYDGKTQLLVANPIDRYLINSPMLPGMKRGADGSLTLYLQHDSPGADLESNWLPAPAGPIYVAMRLYWSKESALKGTWKPPALQLVS
ncbi:MAG: DUF1254 domain-containing protein [Geminicoccaceae bacterium]